MTDNHDVQVKVFLTADQYLAFHDLAQEFGLKDSACLRVLVMKFLRKESIKRLSALELDVTSTEIVPKQDRRIAS
jgi:hypothetical protein